MKNHLTLSISQNGQSREIRIHHLWLKLLGLGFIGAVFVLLASSLTLSGERQRHSAVSQTNSELEDKLRSLTDTAQALEEAIDLQVRDTETVKQELANLERNSGLEANERKQTISERIRLLRQVFVERDNEYLEINDKIDRIEELIGATEEPEALSLDQRIEQLEIGAHQERLLHDYLPSGFPLEKDNISSRFGFRTHPESGDRRFHSGIDLRANVSTPIFATADGVVRESGYSDTTGHRVVIQHNLGFETSYYHLSESLVEQGDIVEKGATIALSGNTGRSSGPHLHYEVRYLGKALDPYPFLRWELGSNQVFAEVKGVKWQAIANLVKRQIEEPALQLSRLDPKYRR